jgi:hyperosmotically inducible periplasmic protein
MMVRNWIAACALGVLTVAPAASAQTHSAAKVDDSAIKSRVEAKLKSADSLKNDRIVVSVDNGVVTLSGTVHSEAQSLRARELAKVEGVTNVENKLDVDSATADAAKGTATKTKDATVKGAEKTKDATVKGAEKTKDATVKGAEKTKDATVRGAEKTKGTAGAAGSKTKDVAGTTGEAITDAWITTAIKTDFINEDTLKGSDINVDTNNHVVTLKGTVATPAGKARAEEIAKTTKGVARVVNTLTVGPKK